MLLKKIYIIIILLFLAIITIAVYKLTTLDKTITITFFSIFASAGLTILAELLLHNFNIINNILVSIFHRKIRISFSQLIRVDINGKYILVPNSRIKNTFQPPGGAIQYYDQKILNKFSLSEDEGYRNSPKEDLRRTMVTPTKLCSLYDWFFSRKGREVSPDREFYEELIKTNILPAKLFDRVKLSYCNTVTPKIKYSTHFDKYECFIFEIFDLIPTEEQKTWMSENINENNSEYILLTREEISRDGYIHSKNESYQLGTQTKYII